MKRLLFLLVTLLVGAAAWSSPAPAEVPSGTAAELVLTHEKFATEAARQDHATGWVGCLGAMAKLL